MVERGYIDLIDVLLNLPGFDISKFLKTWIPADTNKTYNENYSNYKPNSNSANPFLLPLILIVGAGFILIIIKKLKERRTSRKPYN